jgi:hypothetical protein
MKTITTLSILVIALFISMEVAATGNFKVSVVLSDDSKALLSVSNDIGQNYEVSIANGNGDMVYYFETKEAVVGFKQLFDFSKLSPGTYRMEVRMEGAKYEKMLELTTDGVNLTQSLKKTQPYFSYENDVIKLSHLNHGDQPLSFQIYKDGALVWEKQLAGSFAVNEGFDISKLDRGHYQAVLLSGDDAYEYDIAK